MRCVILYPGTRSFKLIIVSLRLVYYFHQLNLVFLPEGEPQVAAAAAIDSWDAIRADIIASNRAQGRTDALLVGTGRSHEQQQQDLVFQTLHATGITRTISIWF